ncbi:MAG: DR2241 family protein [Verrucomicrobiota bacterium]
MGLLENPALKALLAEVGGGIAFLQARIRPAGKGWELRHVEDGERAEGELRSVAVAELRDLAQTTAAGAFRPLKSAPNLRSGWRCMMHSEAELEGALHQLYPGALADWFAAKSGALPVTHYREFTNRQTGMYRITQMLADGQVAAVARAHCGARFCLKRRLWTVDGLEVDEASSKSMVPCLEPCPMLLEFARLAMRMEQEDKMNVELSSSDLETIKGALETALAHPNPQLREADFSAPDNPRRVQLVLEKLRAVGSEREEG